MEIKDWVRAARKHKSWTLQQLGDAVGRTKANVGHWETGKHSPSYAQMLQISQATGYPMPETGTLQMMQIAEGVVEAPNTSDTTSADERLREDLDDLLPEDVERFMEALDTQAKEAERLRQEIHERAEQMRRHRDYLLAKAGSKGVAPASKVAHIPPAPKPAGGGGGAGEVRRPARSHAELESARPPRP